MKKIWKSSLLLVLLSVFLLIGLVGCSSEPEPAPTPEPTSAIEVTPEPEEIEEEEPEEEVPTGMDIHGAIHRIEYGDNVVYLFGSLHAERGAWFPLADVVEEATERADVFAAEIDTFDTEATAAALEDVLLLPDGQTWADFLPQEAYDHLVEVIVAYGIPYEEVRYINPHFLVFSVTMDLVQSLAEDLAMGGLEEGISVDGYVMNIATERGRPVIGLETAEQQMNILYMPPLDVMVDHIMSFLPPEEMLAAIQDSPEPSLDELADAYEQNDLAELADMFARTMSLEAVAEIEGEAGSLWLTYMRETVMNWRSTYYAIEIARLLQETEEPTTFFVVVGASHIIRSMGGEEFTDIVEQLGFLGFDAVPIW